MTLLLQRLTNVDFQYNMQKKIRNTGNTYLCVLVGNIEVGQHVKQHVLDALKPRFFGNFEIETLSYQYFSSLYIYDRVKGNTI